MLRAPRRSSSTSRLRWPVRRWHTPRARNCLAGTGWSVRRASSGGWLQVRGLGVAGGGQATQRKTASQFVFKSASTSGAGRHGTPVGGGGWAQVCGLMRMGTGWSGQAAAAQWLQVAAGDHDKQDGGSWCVCARRVLPDVFESTEYADFCLCPACLLLADYCFYTKQFDQPNQPFRCSENTDWPAPSCTDAAHWVE